MDLLTNLIGAIENLGQAIIVGAALVFSILSSQFVPSVPPTINTPVAEIQNPAPATFPTASTTSKATATSTKATAPKPTTVIQVVTPAKQTVTVQVQVPAQPNIDVNAMARASLVNILCTTQAGGYLNPISGSGIIIDSRGIILTNAHVAQFFLLRDYGVKNNVQCVVRVGSPAAPRYTAELMYLPTAWINANAYKILGNDNKGTGENDFAFLRITGTTDPNGQLPASFSNVPMEAGVVDTGYQMLLASYPAGFIDGLTIEKNLYASSAFSSVGQLYSFDESDHVDVFSIGGTIVSQAGSSGGAVIDAHSGKLDGIIATASASSTTSGRDLNAISTNYINRVLIANGEGGVVGLLSQNAASKAASFNKNVAPGLIVQLSAELKKLQP